MERWTNIKDYEGLYEVSEEGRVRSLKRGKRRILKSWLSGGGYLQIALWKGGKRKKFLVHRLVAQAFLSNPNNYPEINHKDENKLNNCVENLEWCDRQYNIDYSVSKQVAQYDLKGNFIKTWKSAYEIQRQLGFNHSHISQCCLGKIKISHNYYWQYI